MIVAVTGLGREARIVSRPNVKTVIGGGDSARVRTEIQSALDSGARRILSIGICGALSPTLRVGDCIVATEVVTEGERIATHRPWTTELLASIPGAQAAAIAGTQSILSDSTEKRRLRETTNAAAADMESHVVAKAAQELGIPFAALRIVSDSAEQTLPPAAVVGMSPTGDIDYRAVFRSVMIRPGQIPALIRTAWEAEKAFRVLLRCRHVLAPSLAPVNLGKLSLDVG